MTTTTTGNTGSNATPAPKKKKRGRWWKILLGIFVFIVLLVLLTPTLLSTGPGKSFLLGRVNGGIPGKITADSISVGWFSGAKVRNLKIVGPDGNMVIAVASADTGLTLLDAISSSSMDLGNVVVRGFTPHLITFPDGTTNLGRAFTRYPAPPMMQAASGPATETAAAPAQPAAAPAPAPASAQAGMRIKGTLDVDDSGLEWASPGSLTLEITRLKIKSTFDTGGGKCDLDLTADDISVPDKPVTIAANFSGDFFSDGNVKPLGAMRGTGSASVKGVDLMSLSPLFQAAGLRAVVTGRGDLSLTLGNDGGKETVALNAPLTNVTVTGPATDGDTLRMASATLLANATLNGDTVDVQKAGIDSEMIKAGVSGTVKTGAGASGELPPLKINATVDVTSLKKQLPKLLGTMPDTTVAATLSGQADMADKTLTITDASAVNEKDPVTNQGNVIVFDKGSVVSWGTAPNNANIQVAYDLARLQQLVGKSLPEGTILAGKRTMKVHLTGVLAMDAANLKKFGALSIDKTSLGCDRIAVQGFDIGTCDIPFQLDKGVLVLTPTDVPANGGSIHLAGRVDMTGDVAVYTLDKAATPTPFVKNIQLNHQIAAGPLGFLPITWGSSKGSIGDVTGLLNISLGGASLPLDSASLRTKGTLDGSLRIDQLTTSMPVIEQAMAQLGPLLKITQTDALSIKGGQIPETPFALKDGKVSYQNLTIHSSAMDVSVSGSVGLDSSLAMNMSIKTKQANIEVPVGLKGTTSKPELAVSGDALKNNLQNISPNTINDLLKKVK